MVSDLESVCVIPLNGANYSTWKLQCQIALMKDGLCSIVYGLETSLSQSQSERYTKFVTRMDYGLAIIVLSIEPSLLYLVGNPVNLVGV